MAEVVVDTNVLLVAEGKHPNVSDECRLACTQKLHRITQSAIVVIDDEFRVLGEYQNKLDSRRGKGPGAAFLKWVLQNQANPRRVAKVPLTESSAGCFVEFPTPALEPHFDPPDRKFPAIANAHPAKPPILQATDSKWLGWWRQFGPPTESRSNSCARRMCAATFERSFPGRRCLTCHEG